MRCAGISCFVSSAGEIILDLHTACAQSGKPLQIVAVGGPGAELIGSAAREHRIRPMCWRAGSAIWPGW